MKKIFKVIYICLLLSIFLIGPNVYAETPTLQQIAEKFNSSAKVQEYATEGIVLHATVSENKIAVSKVETGATTMAYEFKLEGTILSGAAFTSSGEGTTVYLIFSLLADSTGQFHGYSDGQMISTLFSRDVLNYTLENQGIEYKATTEDKLEFKLDISKKIPLASNTSEYFEVLDVAINRNVISGNGKVSGSKGNLWYQKSGDNGKNTIIIAEKTKLSDNSYLSALSILTVMFNSYLAADYFEENYSDISKGNKEFTGVKVEINPTKTTSEAADIPAEYTAFMRITIDKENYLAGMKEPKKQTEVIVDVPDSGMDKAWQNVVLGIIFVLSGATIVFTILTRKTIKEGL
ncbi:MAG: hypothetical protein IKE63_03660 [Bacilli bacterium]|nr:hypothetical protein [Bacilli bacterium]